MHGRQQADSIIVNFFSADSPTGMFKQLPTDLSAQQSLLSLLDRQLPSEAQQAYEGTEQGITLFRGCRKHPSLHLAQRLDRLKAQPVMLHDTV